MHFGFPDAGNDPTSLPPATRYDLLTDGFGSGFNRPSLLVATVDGEDPATAMVAA